MPGVDQAQGRSPSTSWAPGHLTSDTGNKTGAKEDESRGSLPAGVVGGFLGRLRRLVKVGSIGGVRQGLEKVLKAWVLAVGREAGDGERQAAWRKA